MIKYEWFFLYSCRACLVGQLWRQSTHFRSIKTAVEHQKWWKYVELENMKKRKFRDRSEKYPQKIIFIPRYLKSFGNYFWKHTLAKNSECWDLRSFPSYRPSECYQKLMLRHFVANLFFPHLLLSISVGKNKFWMNFVEKIFLSGCQSSSTVRNLLCKIGNRHLKVIYLSRNTIQMQRGRK